MNFYRIRDWSKHFENNRTRELKRMEWLPVPNKHDGSGFTELLDHPNGVAHYGAWHLILQVASKCDPRGTLLRGGGNGHKVALTCVDIGRMSHSPAGLVEEALSRLVSIGWIELCDNPAPSCDNPAPSCALARARGTEGNGMEVQINKDIGDGNPSLEEVKTAASMTGMLEPDAVAFWNHFEATGWIDKNGHPILSWRAKMGNWKTNARAASFELNHHSQRPRTTLELKTIIEAKNSLSAQLRTKFCSESAMTSHWQDDAKKAEYFKLKREAKELQTELSNMA